MPLKNNPGCDCCDDVNNCCQTITVKPLPLRTVDILTGLASYDDTTWNSSYVSGISGTDNTVPANTTVTIAVPIGCTDYVVDVEVLDDAGQHSSTSEQGLFIKVGDCLQASNEIPSVVPSSFWSASTINDKIQWPITYSQHDCRVFERDYFNSTYTTITRPFYGDFYAAYRFAEIFTSAAMESTVAAYRAPPYRFDTSTSLFNQCSTLRHPHDAGGMTVQITIRTGANAVEIGMIKVYAGHRLCSSITSLSDVPLSEVCNLDLSDNDTADNPWFTVKNCQSFITNNGDDYLTSSKSGPVQTSSGCASPTCTYDYTANLDISAWNGLYSWRTMKSDLFSYYQYDYSDGAFRSVDQPFETAPLTSYANASAGDIATLNSHLDKLLNQNWTHSDRLIDWRQYLYQEVDLSDELAIDHSLTITGSCNIVASSQATIDADLNAVRDRFPYPSTGFLFMETIADVSALCTSTPTFCTGWSQQTYDSISYSTGSAGATYARPLMPEGEFAASDYGVKKTYGLLDSHAFPAAGQTQSISDDHSFVLSPYSVTQQSGCFLSYSFNGYDYDVSNQATIGKIPTYGENDNGGSYEYTRIGGKGFDNIPTRDYHLQNLSLYINSESSTFTAATGLVMQYTAINSSQTRPDYSTCGCPCTASELYSDDLFSINNPCVKYHRWMQFTDGTDTWYCKWVITYTGLPSPPTYWTFLFRRKSDCKEIEFTEVSSTLPNTTRKITKTKTNSSSDTLSVDVFG